MTILGDLEGCHIHGVELYVVLAVVVYHLVGEYTPAFGDQVASAFPVEGNHLRGSLVVLVDGGHSGLVYAVEGVCVPCVQRRVLGDRLRRCLLVRKKMLRQLPLNSKALPSLIKGHHGLGPLGWHATFVENHFDVVLTPLGVMVDSVPLEGLGRELCSGPVSGTLLLPWGDVDVNDVLPRRLGAGLLWGSGGGLVLLGGGSLCHVGGFVSC